ncbi:MAG: class I SAM-dependent methyltransferase [Dehalococcoidia bacterium]
MEDSAKKERREQLRTTFNAAAELYQEARPEYPEALYDELLRLTGLTAGSRLLEVGCATGKATLPLARRGYGVTCVELGPELAAAARRNLAPYPNMTVIEADFETWSPAVAEFDLVFAATAWGWIDPAVRYEKAWQLLKPGGHLAFWNATHVFPEGGDPFFAEIQDVYDEIGEGLPGVTGWSPEVVARPRPDQLRVACEEIEASGRLEDCVAPHFDWEVIYDAEGYIKVLNTFSGHIAMQAWQRERLCGEIRRRLAARPDGRLRRHWGAVLHVARRRGKAKREVMTIACVGPRPRP